MPIEIASLRFGLLVEVAFGAVLEEAGADPFSLRLTLVLELRELD